MERIDLLVRVVSLKVTRSLLFQENFIKEENGFAGSEYGRPQSTPFT